MRRLLIGPALTGLGYLTGSYYGADAEQVVHKTPADTYQGVSDWIGSLGESGTTSFEGGKPVPYQIQLDRTSDHHLTMHVLFDGKEGATTDLDFVPQAGGEWTLIKARAHGNTSVLSSALSGTAMARMAYAPDWMLNMFTLHPLLQQVGQQIEKGDAASDQDQPANQQQPPLTQDQQNQEAAWQQYDASRPTVDPDADAKRYMNGGNAS